MTALLATVKSSVDVSAAATTMELTMACEKSASPPVVLIQMVAVPVLAFET